MKTVIQNAKVPFTKGKFSKIKNVRYLSWEDAFDVEFADGLCILDAPGLDQKLRQAAGGGRRALLVDHLKHHDRLPLESSADGHLVGHGPQPRRQVPAAQLADEQVPPVRELLVEVEPRKIVEEPVP